MWKKRAICALLLAALLLALPTTALAAKKASIRFPVKAGLMTEGGEVALTAKLKRITAAEVVWESSDETVARVWEGKLQAVAAGCAAITASGGGAKAKMAVVVLPASLTVGVGEKVSLPYGKVEKYKIKDKKIASVSKKGVVLGRAAGQTELLVKCGKQKLILPVTVTQGSAGTQDAAGTQSAAASLDCAAQTDQIVLVEHTGGSKATLSVHEKQNGVWKELMSCNAYVGKNGMGKTVAGDKKTPVGTFNLTTPFGIKADPGAKMAYTQVTEYHYWCGDSTSKYYNQLVDERTADRKHTSADEYLIKYKGVYNYCLFIDYNAEGTPGKGSCIFLHCTGKNKYTGGCVAIPEADMKNIVCWARPGAKIVIREKPAS